MPMPLEDPLQPQRPPRRSRDIHQRRVPRITGLRDAWKDQQSGTSNQSFDQILAENPAKAVCPMPLHCTNLLLALAMIGAHMVG